MPEKKQPDKKLQALKAQSCLNPRADHVKDALFDEDAFFDPRDIVQVKYEMLRKVDVDKQPVTEAAQSFGFSRPSFYQAKQTFEQEGLMGLVPKKRGPRTRHKISEQILSFVKQVLDKEGRLSMVEVAARVQERFGVKIHPRSLERALAGKKKFQ